MRVLPCGFCAAVDDEPHTDECEASRGGVWWKVTVAERDPSTGLWDVVEELEFDSEADAIALVEDVEEANRGLQIARGRLGSVLDATMERMEA